MNLRIIVLTLAAMAAFSCSPYSNMNEQEMLATVRELADHSERSDGLEQFLKRFPASAEIRKIRAELIDAYVAAGSESKAVSAARVYLDSVPDSRKVVETVDIIVKLATNGLVLDTCAVWLEPMETRAQTMHPYYQAACLNAKALIQHRRKNLPAALLLQTEAVEKYGEEQEFIRNLAVYEQESGHVSKAMNHVVPLAIQGDEKSVDYVLQWSGTNESGEGARAAFKDSVVREAVRLYVDTAGPARQSETKSQAAVFMARTGVDLDRARMWADETVQSLDSRSPVERVMDFTRNRALVLAALGKKTEALEVFGSIEALIDPWQRDGWMTYGRLLEETGQAALATRVYATALLATQDEDLQAAFERAYTTSNGTRKGLSGYITNLKDSLARFAPPHRERSKPSGRVVLAELFTGADCGPCVSADLAFDALSEYYGRDELAILEYHLHIPRPDPLTTNDSWERYRYYGGDYGTPTTFFDGTDKVGGGGPKFLIGNRFAMYQKTVEKSRSDSSRSSLSVAPVWKDNSLRVDLTFGDKAGHGNPSVLHVALVEKSVKYTGSNGINPHAFVVRKLADGSKGMVIRPGSSKASRQIDMNQVDRELQTMIDRPETLPSRSSSMTKKPVWKTIPEKMNRDNLAIVVWIQEPASKQVLLTAYADVPARK